MKPKCPLSKCKTSIRLLPMGKLTEYIWQQCPLLLSIEMVNVSKMSTFQVKSVHIESTHVQTDTEYILHQRPLLL